MQWKMRVEKLEDEREEGIEVKRVRRGMKRRMCIIGKGERVICKHPSGWKSQDCC